jgi:hypothetical protein
VVAIAFSGGSYLALPTREVGLKAGCGQNCPPTSPFNSFVNQCVLLGILFICKELSGRCNRPAFRAGLSSPEVVAYGTSSRFGKSDRKSVEMSDRRSMAGTSLAGGSCAASKRPIANRPQDSILPHKASAVCEICELTVWDAHKERQHLSKKSDIISPLLCATSRIDGCLFAEGIGIHKGWIQE